MLNDIIWVVRDLGWVNLTVIATVGFLEILFLGFFLKVLIFTLG